MRVDVPSVPWRIASVAWGAGALVACAGTTHIGGPAADGFGDAGQIDTGAPIDAGFDVYTLPPSWSGGAAKVLTSGVSAVAIASDTQAVYWQGAGGAIFACPLSGCAGGKATLLSALIGSQSQLETLVASNGTAVFLTEQGASLSSVSFSKPTATSTSYQPDGVNLTAIVSDGNAVYFSGSAISDAGGYGPPFVGSCPFGAPCTAPATIYQATGNDYYGVGPLAVSGSELYFAFSDNEQSSSIVAVPISGGAPRTVCSSQNLYGVQALVVAGGFAYFTSDSGGGSEVYQCPTGGGSPQVYVNDYAPYALATDGTNLYWTNFVSTTGTVATCQLGATCTSPFTVADNQDSPYAITASSSGVYWSTSSGVSGATR